MDARNPAAVVFTPTTGAEVQERLVEESEAAFTGLPLGVALQVVVAALNRAGETTPTAPVAITLS